MLVVARATWSMKMGGSSMSGLWPDADRQIWKLGRRPRGSRRRNLGTPSPPCHLHHRRTAANFSIADLGRRGAHAAPRGPAMAEPWTRAASSKVWQWRRVGRRRGEERKEIEGMRPIGRGRWRRRPSSTGALVAQRMEPSLAAVRRYQPPLLHPLPILVGNKHNVPRQ